MVCNGFWRVWGHSGRPNGRTALGSLWRQQAGPAPDPCTSLWWEGGGAGGVKISKWSPEPPLVQNCFLDAS